MSNFVSTGITFRGNVDDNLRISYDSRSQLAHGMEDDNDLMVRFPRIVYSLR